MIEWREVTSGQWVLLNRAHALVIDRHPLTGLLWMKDESYLATVLHTLGLQNETTCDWQVRLQAKAATNAHWLCACFQQEGPFCTNLSLPST